MTTSASRPSITARACLAAPPCDCLIATSFAGLAFPVFGEGRVELLVELTRRVIRDVEQRCLLRVRDTRAEQESACSQGNSPAAREERRHSGPLGFCVRSLLEPRFVPIRSERRRFQKQSRSGENRPSTQGSHLKEAAGPARQGPAAADDGARAGRQERALRSAATSNSTSGCAARSRARVQ